MGALIFSAIGTANRFMGPGAKLDFTKLDPGKLMSTSGGAGPTAAQAAAEARTPLAQRLREEMLETMGIRAEDLMKMKPETRTDLEAQMARHIHEQILNAKDVRTGSLVDVQA